MSAKSIAKQAAKEFFNETGFIPSDALAFDEEKTRPAYRELWNYFLDGGSSAPFEVAEDWLHQFLTGRYDPSDGTL